MVINDLITSCPAPVSTAAGVTQAMEWFEIVSAFSITTTSEIMPNRLYVRNLCEVAAKNTILASEDYDSINNNLMHVKVAVDACIQIKE